MIVHKDSARDMRCCGPVGCGSDARDTYAAPKQGGSMCIGPQCMAWRVVPSGWMSKDSANHGWCGLAGEPVRAPGDVG